MLNLRSGCGGQASETHRLPRRCSGEHWVEARDEAGVGTGARAKLAHDADR